MVCFIFRRKHARVEPLVVEECWPTKKARVSGYRKRRSVHVVFGSETQSEPGLTEPGHDEVHTEDHDVAAHFQSEPGHVHTEETALEVETANFELVVCLEEVNDEPSSPKKPVNKTKMLSDLVCVEEVEPKIAKAKKGTRRGRKRQN